MSSCAFKAWYAAALSLNSLSDLAEAGEWQSASFWLRSASESVSWIRLGRASEVCEVETRCDSLLMTALGLRKRSSRSEIFGARTPLISWS